ncbi:hypothetical protein C7999DRAFT_10631 [Corynascus novoguineensis]|uniref:BTB domain-containing protein n=1 Tax=Corynascus novoguineensis TaxID=1126955 RepID=A0AAN7HUJ4_9PEZI|nr:hypothetical protein C7999DRAFT_10631 [Corynascus novoguineensis]
MTDRSQATQSSRAIGAQVGSQDVQSVDSWLTDRIVTVIVGPEEKRWIVHEKLLVSQSDFFRDYFMDGHDELKLPDDEPRLFALFIRWLYGTAFVPSGGTRNFRFLPPDGVTVTVRDYLGVYVLGGKFGIVGVRNAVLDVLYAYYGDTAPGSEQHHRAPNMHDITYVFAHTARDAPMRRFLIAHALFYLFSRARSSRGARTSSSSSSALLLLPLDWEQVLSESAEVGYEMIRMLAEWNWVMGANAPRMTIKARTEFHERVPGPADPVKQELTEDEEGIPI